MIGQSIRLNTSIMLSCLKAIIPEQVPAVAAISCLGHAVCLDPVCPAPRATKQIPLYHSFTRKHVQAISCCNTQNLPHFPTAVRLSQYVFYCGATQSHPSSIYVTKSCKSAIKTLYRNEIACGCVTTGSRRPARVYIYRRGASIFRSVANDVIQRTEPLNH